MQVFFKPTFIKDLKKLPLEIREEVSFMCLETFPALRDIRNFRGYPIKQLAGFKNYYRIKVREYRIGFKKPKQGVILFMRVLHRKDIYKHFP